MSPLDSIRSELNQLMEVACQESGLTNNDFENIGFVEFAKRIKNPVTKEKYRKLASKLLVENIRALQTDDQNEFTSEWANTLLMWCTVREELQHV